MSSASNKKGKDSLKQILNQRRRNNAEKYAPKTYREFMNQYINLQAVMMGRTPANFRRELALSYLYKQKLANDKAKENEKAKKKAKAKAKATAKSKAKAKAKVNAARLAAKAKANAKAKKSKNSNLHTGANNMFTSLGKTFTTLNQNTSLI